jgi:hypothetical protein
MRKLKTATRYATKGLLAITLSAMLIVSGCSTSWVQVAVNDLPVLVQIATSILGIVAAAQGKGAVDPAVAAKVQIVAGQVKSDLELVQSLVAAYQSAAAADKPGLLSKVDSALSSVQSNLNALLAAAHVNNAALQATIAASVGLAITTVLAIQSLIPAPAAKGARSAVKPMNAKQLRSSFNSIVASNGYAEFAIQ